MQISKRLTALALLVTEGSRLADVGTDHGYVPIYLIEQNRIPSAIAMDINEGPLERAKEHIALFGFGSRIETRLSDGLEALKAGEADTILIAGMGGALMQRILEDGRQTAQSARELILQPQSELHLMRRYLQEQGYRILSEHMVYEEGKYYPFMKVQPGPASCTEEMTEEELYFGKLSLQQNPEVLLDFLNKSLQVQRSIQENLKNAGQERGRTRMEEVRTVIARLSRCREQILNERHY